MSAETEPGKAVGECIENAEDLEEMYATSQRLVSLQCVELMTALGAVSDSEICDCINGMHFSYHSLVNATRELNLFHDTMRSIICVALEERAEYIIPDLDVRDKYKRKAFGGMSPSALSVAMKLPFTVSLFSKVVGLQAE